MRNIAEAWRKRRYPASFIAKLVDAEGEAAEVQVWLEFAAAESNITTNEFEEIFANMKSSSNSWFCSAKIQNAGM